MKFDPSVRPSMTFTFCHEHNPLYETCKKPTLSGDEYNECEEFLSCLCENDEAGYSFGPYCNARSHRLFTNTVLNAYDKVVDRWIIGDQPHQFLKRGWDSTHSNHDTRDNIVRFCNDRVDVDSQNSRLNKCDDWFSKICDSHPEVDVESYPWCACITSLPNHGIAYDMNYYDPDSYVFGNPNVTGSGPGGTASVTTLPNNPYCYVDRCRSNPAAYRWGKNLRGEHGCPECINVFNPQNVNFVNSKVTQVCSGDDYEEEDLIPPTVTPPSNTIWGVDYLWIVIGGFGVLAFFMVVLVVIRKRTTQRQKQAQEEVFKMAAMVSSTNTG